MELTNEQFTQITGASLAQPVYDGTNDRRQHPRIAFGSRAKIVPVFDTFSGNGKRVLVRDISLQGIGFLCHDPMDIGDEFVIHLPTQSDHAIPVHCMVQRCDGGGTGGAQFIIGATFELVLDTIVPSNETARPNGNATGMPATCGAATPTPADDQSDTPSGGGYLAGVARSVAGLMAALKGNQESSKIRKRLRSNEKDKRAEPTPAPRPQVAQTNHITHTPPASMIGTAPEQPAPARGGGLFIRTPAPILAPALTAAPAPIVVTAPLAEPAPAAAVAEQARVRDPGPIPAPAPIAPPAPMAVLAPTTAPAPIATLRALAAAHPAIRPAIDVAVCVAPLIPVMPPEAEAPTALMVETIEPAVAAGLEPENVRVELQLSTLPLEQEAADTEEVRVPSSAILFVPTQAASSRLFSGPVAHRHPRQRRRR